MNPNAGDAVWYADTRQASASVEGLITNAGDAVRNRYTFKTATVFEKRIPNAGYITRKCDACQLAAISKSVIFYTCNALRYCIMAVFP